MTQVGSLRMCLDPDVVPPLAGFLLFAVEGVFSMFSLCLLYAFFNLLTVFYLFITPGTMFQATIASLQAQVKSGVVDPLLTHELEQLRNIRFVASCLLFFVHSVADPYVFGPPGSGSISQR